MTFAECLQDYLTLLDCTAKQLSESAGLSGSMLSRYLSGERVPASDGKSLQRLAHGIAGLAAERPALDISEEAVLKALTRARSGIEIDYDFFCVNLNQLIRVLNINNNDLARALNFDPSYISRILSGQRRPGNLPAFLSGISSFVARRYANDAYAPVIAQLTGCEAKDTASESTCAQVITGFLGSNTVQAASPLTSFLTNLDAFDLNEYIRALHFDEMKVPTVPCQLPSTKTYRGVQEMMEAEIDFLKAAVLSCSKEDVIIYTDMPLEKMAADTEFPKKWMYGMALMLKKGLHLHMIHDVHRPFYEMMLGLESWIPMYMTGQISPWYLKRPQNDTFLHHLKSAGTVALSGEAIAGHQEQGRYIVTKKREDVRYYRTRAQQLLKCAHPLMRIYRREDRDAWNTQLAASAQGGGRYRSI